MKKLGICDMSKKLIVISIILVSLSVVFASCSSDKKGNESPTVAVTDSNGTTHYYELVTDEDGNALTTDNEQAVFVEIVTDKDGTYITNEHTTVMPFDNGSVNQNSSANSTEKNNGDILDADNTVNFESFSPKPDTTETVAQSTTSTTKQETTSTTESTNPPATDSEGWVTKWY